MPYRILEDEATADVAYVVTGKSLAAVLKDSAISMLDTIAERKSISKKIKKEIKLDSIDAGKLLYNFLQEIIYLKDAGNIVFSEVNVRAKEKKSSKGSIFSLNATLYGDRIDSSRQKMKADVKAVTLHMFSMKKTGKGWRAKIVFDI